MFHHFYAHQSKEKCEIRDIVEPERISIQIIIMKVHVHGVLDFNANVSGDDQVGTSRPQGSRYKC